MSSEKRRLAIFLFYDDQGIVDEYVLHLLTAVRASAQHLLVVVNGQVNEAGRQALSAHADDLRLRENIGLDIGAWREGILSFLGRDFVAGFDELWLLNDSFFGPFYPFEEVFAEMAGRKLDFWGLTAHGAVPGAGRNPYGHRPAYLQSYFLVFTGRMLRDDAFYAFWTDQPVYRDTEEATEMCVSVLTRRFADLGYSWGAFCDTRPLEAVDDRKNFDFHSFRLYDLIAHRRYPVLKRRSFRIPKAQYLRYGDASDLPRSVEYIRDRYGYDLGMAFRHLLRKYDARDIKEAMNYDFVVGSPYSEVNSDMPAQAPSEMEARSAVVAHLVYEGLFPYALRYLDQVPRETDLLVTTNAPEKAQALEVLLRPRYGDRLRVIEAQPRGRDLSALLVAAAPHIEGYQYLCFLHDKKSSQKEYLTVGEAFSDILWENLLGSEAHIRGIFRLLDQNPWIGLLTPPGVQHGSYFQSSVDYWTVCYDETVALAKRLGLDAARLRRDKPPLSVGSCFWCRREALRPLLDQGFTYQDFPDEPLPDDGSFSHAMERIFPYVAQAQGYCTAWVYTPEAARTGLSDLRYMLDATTQSLSGTTVVRFSSFAAFLDSLRKARKLLLRHSHPHWVRFKERLYAQRERLPEGLRRQLRRLSSGRKG